MALMIVAFAFATWHHNCFRSISSNHICRFATDDPQPVCVEGQIVSRPQVASYDDSPSARRREPKSISEFSFRVQRIRDGKDWQRVTGKLQVRVLGTIPERHCHSNVRLFGYLSLPPSPSNPGEFNRRQFLREKGIHAQLVVPQTQSIQTSTSKTGYRLERWNSIARTSCHRRIADALSRHFSHETLHFVNATLLGDQTKLADQTKQSFRETGTSHLLAISGLHLGILCGPLFVMTRLGWASRSVTLTTAIIFVWFFCWLVEFRPPIVRASVLVTIIATGKLLGREIHGWNSLALAALVILILNPSHLFSVGAQLSFLAVATLLQHRESTRAAIAHDPLQRLVDSSRALPSHMVRRLGYSILAVIHMCFWLWVVSAPLVAARFHFSAPIGILINPLVLLPMTIALCSAALVVVADVLCPALAQVAAVPGEWSIRWILTIVELGSEWKHGGFATMGPTDWWIVGFYVGMLVVGCNNGIRVAKRWKIALLLAWCAIGTIPDSYSSILRMQRDRSEEFAITFVDVGHGTAVICQLEDGRVLLYDCGSMGGSQTSARQVSSVLWHERVPHLDAIVLSHCDADHYNGVSILLDRFSIGAVYVEPSMLASSDPDWKITLDRLVDRKIPIRSLCSEMRFNGFGEGRSPCVEFDVLHPHQNTDVPADNERSVTLRIKAFGRTILLPGDLEKRTLRDLLRKYVQECDVLMAPHHGSGTIPINEVVVAWTPENVVISGSSNDKTESVSRRYANNGARVFHTQLDGAVRVFVGPERVRVATFRKPTP